MSGWAQYRNFNSIKVQLEQHLQQYLLQSMLFQFHKGTIRTGGFGEFAVSFVPFQFHKGTIRTFHRVIVEVHFDEFQFHKGTIRTGIGSTEGAAMWNFNSIKVQLELSIASRHAASSISYFNSIKVQLELLPVIVKHIDNSHFNSIKVQLEHHPSQRHDRDTQISIP